MKVFQTYPNLRIQKFPDLAEISAHLAKMKPRPTCTLKSSQTSQLYKKSQSKQLGSNFSPPLASRDETPWNR